MQPQYGVYHTDIAVLYDIFLTISLILCILNHPIVIDFISFLPINLKCHSNACHRVSTLNCFCICNVLCKATLPYLQCFKSKRSESLRLADLKAAYILLTLTVIVVGVTVATDQVANNDNTGLFSNLLLNR